ncbi:MAG: peptide/nickel transport system permease protein [Thermomicrobiales bacterium]|jgi:peptide/nickel transport system permease protein|nr:peptide/nickel transport system permease protein [Thermomicrobiales bacterium]MEA2528131.1 peptide/nickel transport system permease protein [Thermomicrobiales bacterium]MEA2528623.1 peptide/nickel transport system permease protein [Thermomicrobiales bacterium]
MALVLIRRVVWMIPIVLGVSLVVFSMMHLAPGDPAEAILGPRGTEELLRKARKDLGLDRPLYVQYGSWVIGAAQGDLGESYRLNRAVMPEVLAKLKNSAYLASIAFVVAVLVGIAVGASSAVRRGGLLDNLLMASTVTGISMPPFYLGMLLIILFSVKLDLLPTGGMYDVRQDPSTEQLVIHLILPTLTLAAVPIAVIARIMRSSMLEVIGQDYIRTARAKGLRDRGVVIRHALRNALIPVVAVVGLQVGYLLSATALVEVVFSWPGLGSLLVQSVVTRDLPLAQGAVLLIAIIYVVVNILTDLVQAWLDPRIHFS